MGAIQAEPHHLGVTEKRECCFFIGAFEWTQLKTFCDDGLYRVHMAGFDGMDRSGGCDK
jgi:hypothetical protein